MSLAACLMSFRFSQTIVAQLDRVVSHERAKGPMLSWTHEANRTSVLRALIERECLRLDDEEARARAKLEYVIGHARDVLSQINEGEETSVQRRNRLQRERRARNAQLAG